MNDPLFHYCPGVYVPDILTHGQLLPSAAGAQVEERPTLWFTSRPTYEPTAVKMVVDGRFLRLLTLQEMAEGYGLARFVVPEEVAPLTWNDWVNEIGVPRHEAEVMAQYAETLGSDDSLYRATFEAVPVSDCIAVEMSTDNQSWITLG